MRIQALLLLLGMPVGLAAEPVIREIAPRGAQRGKTFQLLLKGTGLTTGATLETTLPASVSRLSPSRDLMRPESELPFLIELKKDAPPGLYPVRVHTPDGLSNVALFAVGDLPETAENEAVNPKQKNGETSTAEPVTPPAVVAGTLPGADVDLYAFDTKAGQKLVFESEARVIGSAIDPAIEILDSTGKVLARNDDAPGNGIDARLEFAFPKAGRYFVRIHDSKYSDQAQNFYRLKIASYQFAEALFPLGWRRGEPVEVELVGGNLTAPAKAQPDTASKRRWVPVPLAGSHSLPLLFELSDQPEAIEPAGAAAKPLKPGAIMNGRISTKGEVDKYTVAVKPGEHWLFELRASSLGTSQLDGLLTVYDKNGKKIASKDDLTGSDPVLPVEIPKDVDEVTLAVEDLLGRGGPAFGYRLEANQTPPDFEVRLNTPFVNVPAGGTALVATTLQRRGYDGAVRITIPNLPKGFHQAGGHVAPSYAQQRFDDPNPLFNAIGSTITITADPDVAPTRLELEVVAAADIAGKRVTRVAKGPGMAVAVRGLRAGVVTADWLEMKLPMSTSKPLPVRITTPVSHVRLAQGVEYAYGYKVERSPTARLTSKPRDTVATAVGNLRILQGIGGGDSDKGTMLINTNFETPVETFDFYSSATAEVDGRQFTVFSPVTVIDVVHGYRVLPESAEVRAAPGTSFRIAGKTYREPTFEGGLVKIEAQELPEGVSCSPAESAADSREFALDCAAAAAAAKGTHQIQLASSAPDTGRKAKDTYKIPPVPLKLRIQ